MVYEIAFRDAARREVVSVGVIYAFGDFELDVDRFELRRADVKLEVQPKVLRLLLHLIL